MIVIKMSEELKRIVSELDSDPESAARFYAVYGDPGDLGCSCPCHSGGDCERYPSCCSVGSIMKQIPPELDAIAKTVLSYKPPEKEKATNQREKRKKRGKKK